MSSQIYDVTIIGSGPAGYTAALYASRAHLKTLVITGDQPGGQLTTTTEVENYPGFSGGIMGPELMEEMKKQIERFGAVVENDIISKIKDPFGLAQGGQKSNIQLKNKKEDKTFEVVGDKQIYKGKSIILATGASAKYLGLHGEKRLIGKGVSACATCDGFFFKDKEVVVIGGGDTAMEEADFLTRFASKVTIIHRREEFRASSIMLEKVKNNSKIFLMTNKQVIEVLGDNSVTGVRVRDVKTGKEEEIKTQGMFLAIGHKPNTGFLKGLVEMDEKGYIIIKSNIINQISNIQTKNQISKINNSMLLPQTETSVPGMFAAGDCVDPQYRQAVVAAGMGCQAAIDAQKWLEEKKA